MTAGPEVLKRLVDAALAAGRRAWRRRPPRRPQLALTWGPAQYSGPVYRDRYSQEVRTYLLTVEVTGGRVTPEHFADDRPLVIRPDQGQFLELPLGHRRFLRDAELSDGAVAVRPQRLRRRHKYQLDVTCSEPCGPLTWHNLADVDVRYREASSVDYVQRRTLADVLGTAVLALLSLALFGFAGWLLVWAASFLVAGERIEGTATGETFDNAVCLAAQCTELSATHSVVTYTTDDGTTDQLAVIGSYEPGAPVDVLVSPLGGLPIATEIEALAYIAAALVIFYYGGRVVSELAF